MESNQFLVAKTSQQILVAAVMFSIATALVGCAPQPEYHPEIHVFSQHPYKDVKEERLKVLKCGWEASDRLYYCDLENLVNYDLDDSYATYKRWSPELGNYIELDKRWMETVGPKSVAHVYMGTLVYGDIVTTDIFISSGRKCERDYSCADRHDYR